MENNIIMILISIYTSVIFCLLDSSVHSAKAFVSQRMQHKKDIMNKFEV